MDADCLDRLRDRVLSRREKRWSMNSQRLEEIVAELMKPISDVRRSFDTDLSALLEEYLTEAGLHALDAETEDEEDGGGSGALLTSASAAPNFAELALLLQHSASVYGRKVDFLYQHVLSVSDSLQNSAQELERSTAAADAEAGAESSHTPGRRRRLASAAVGFEPLVLTPCAGCAREPAPARPPPTLPRVYIELEPRQLAPGDRALTDYEGEPVGLLADFHVAWRLQDGMLVDELEGWGGGTGRNLRPIPLMELQAAIEANAPPALPPAAHDPRAETPDPRAATPPPPSPLHASTPLPTEVPVKKERKRRSDVSTDDLVGGCYKIVLSKALRRKLRKLEEFSIDSSWISGVVAQRRERILRERRRNKEQFEQDQKDFRGFDASNLDAGGFLGWSSVEAATATETANATRAADGGDSDDDGFFEQSSLGDSDASRVDDSSLAVPLPSLTALDSSCWSAWQAGVVARAMAGEARGLDVRELAERVIAQLPPLPLPAAGPAPRAHCTALLARAARDHADVPGLFLATLFLANAGSVEVIPGPPLSLNSFSARLLSGDARLLAAAALGEPHCPR